MSKSTDAMAIRVVGEVEVADAVCVAVCSVPPKRVTPGEDLNRGRASLVAGIIDV